MINKIVSLGPTAYRDLYWEVVNDTIVTSDWTAELVSPANAAPLVLSRTLQTEQATYVRVSSPTPGAVYYLLCNIVCGSGQQFHQRVIVVINRIN